MNTEAAKEFTQSYYRPGDFVQRQGDFARFFSVIEEGEVEVLHAAAENSEPKLVAVLGKGDFFGETALLGNRPDEASIRARTAVRLRQAGSVLFSEIAGTFAPFREVLSKAVIRRSGNFWDLLPEARSILAREPLATLVDALPVVLLHKDTALANAITALNESPTGELLVLDEAQHLWATLDRNDLHQIVARVTLIPIEKRGDVSQHKVSDFISENRLSVTLEDSALAANNTMLDHGISWLPVVRSKEDPRPVGCLRADRIVARVIHKVAEMETFHEALPKRDLIFNRSAFSITGVSGTDFKVNRGVSDPHRAPEVIVT